MPRIDGYFHNYAGIGGFKQHAGSFSGSALQDVVLQPSGQTSLRPFDASGVLEYRFGPHEMWAYKTGFIASPGGSPADDGLWPIMHSGHLVQAIKNRALQQLYDGGEKVFVTSTVGALEVTSTDAQFRVAGDPRTDIHFSGVLNPPDTDHESGDFDILTHSTPISHAPVTVTSQAEADAMSLGPASAVYDSGSGLVNMLGADKLFMSGHAGLFSTGFNSPQDIAMFNPLIDDGDILATLASGNGTDALVLLDGLYMCGFSISYERNGSSTARNIVQATVTRNGVVLRGSRARGYQRQATVDKVNCARMFFCQLEAGDLIAVQFRLIHGVAFSPSDVITNNDECIFWLKYLGPRRTARAAM